MPQTSYYYEEQLQIHTKLAEETFDLLTSLLPFERAVVTLRRHRHCRAVALQTVRQASSNLRRLSS